MEGEPESTIKLAPAFQETLKEKKKMALYLISTVFNLPYVTQMPT